MAADRREGDATGGDATPEALVRATADPASGALVVLRTGPRPPDGEAGSATGGSRDLAALEEEALDRFEVRACRLRAARGGGDGPAVTAVVRAPHRRAAFEAARWALAAARERLGTPGPAGDGAEGP